jgi:DNA-binding CsgD family transcriptional regulator/PAS domain-containing protein
LGSRVRACTKSLPTRHHDLVPKPGGGEVTSVGARADEGASSRESDRASPPVSDPLPVSTGPARPARMSAGVTGDPLLLLRPCYPAPDDPDIQRLLELLSAAIGTAAVELELRSEGAAEVLCFRKGRAATEAIELELDAPGLDAATLRLAPGSQVNPALRELATFALEKVLLALRMRRRAVLLREVLDSTTNAVLLFDLSGDIVYANPPGDRLLSRQTEDGLVVRRPPIPLLNLLCYLIERIVASGPNCPSWLGTMALSDGSVLVCELMQVQARDGAASGVLAILQTVTALPDRCRGALAASYNFSPREEDVVRLLQEGLTTSELGERLRISPHTVRDHLRHLYRKTGTSSRRELLSLLQSATLAPPIAAASRGDHGAPRCARIGSPRRRKR